MGTWRRVAISAMALAALGAAQAANASSALSGSPTTDNAFFAFVSSNPAVLGTQVGFGNAWGNPFPVSSSTLGPGTYYLQIESINEGGPGGMSGVFNLSGDGLFANGSNTLTTDPANIPFWSGGYNNSNSTETAQTWVEPTGGVLQATSNPWGNVVGTPNWIWPSDPSSSPSGGSGPCGNCTVDFMAQFTVGASIPPGVPEPATWALMLLGVGAVGATLRMNRRTAAVVG